MDRPGESTLRVAYSSFVRRPGGEASPRRLGETCPKPSLDSRLTEIWVVLAHDDAFSCSHLSGGRESTTPGRAPPVAGAREGRSMRGAAARSDLSAVVGARARALCKEKAAWKAAREDEVR
jgi:hypothetical protein